ncbi:hypothetical protein AB0A69_24985 [Streptomyces sp. NPDC045431]|uniref:hypothetical protein n=1 Tax=Streptomyces sp. NPDC045431 TaxID=3155613 RepID=UPI0033F3FF5D
MDTTRRTLLRGLAAAPLAAAAGGLLVPETALAAAGRQKVERVTGPEGGPTYAEVIRQLNERAAGELGRRQGLWRVPLATLLDSPPERTGRRITRVSYPTAALRPPARRIPRLAHGFQWHPDDFLTPNWRPQGITTNYDAVGGRPARRVLIVSWDAHKAARPEGTRLSVVEIASSGEAGYRHVLLAEPVLDGEKGPNPSFRPIHTHAGAVAWYRNLLYVAESAQGRRGLRVFDVDNIFGVRTDAASQGRFGFEDGRYSADGYAYVIPQVAAYQDVDQDVGQEDGDAFTYSQVALDRSGSTHRLVVSEYRGGGSRPRPRIARFDLDPSTGLPARHTSSVPLVYTGPKTVQGAVSVNGTYYVTTSHSAKGNGQLHRWRARPRTWEFPPGIEDVSYDARDDVLWTLCEYAKGDQEAGEDLSVYNTRYVYGMKL